MNPISTTPSIPPSTAVGESVGGSSSGATEADLAAFAALVERLVHAQAHPVRPGPGAPAVPGSTAGDPTAGATPATPEDAATDPDEPGAATVPPNLMAPGQPVPLVTLNAGGPAAADRAAGQPGRTVGPTAVGAAATAVPGAGTTTAAAGAGLADGLTPDATTTTGTAPTAAPAEPAPAIATASPAQPVVPASTPAAAPGAVDGGSPAPAAPPSPTQQVLPEMARLVSRGNGTHRLTMTLQPEVLGEVRITLTVRNGEVHVRLAAGEHAQHALREGTPELQHVLQLAGATDTRVVVRDLPTTVPAAPSASQAATTSYDARADHGAAGHGRRDTDDHHARTRGGSFARDGADDGAAPLRPDPVRPARATGLDLTM